MKKSVNPILYFSFLKKFLNFKIKSKKKINKKVKIKIKIMFRKAFSLLYFPCVVVVVFSADKYMEKKRNVKRNFKSTK